ncbi:NADPH-dependent 2,4-dienoyl-CoA reductase/sulfur reductase-like enzyme [Isoptericola jiangsuensis]|uniref:NADPH-dependent 2,4-dienoyl-CoA reductase/sulfur reductase-like enzyme n=1 Tax=Isoptericola jiangsuensis TaxID=548579 RepID=A0A2A9EUA5_9MICO|nr:FAD-dependent oxidoreductase [Isoptericola jiangsuensis]PFG42323.1 NADPH-dependent 2,4-dienoyl-CoA reductase/sulfur reductase-like enzyme [Isoptericola jiangsuensis]
MSTARASAADRPSPPGTVVVVGAGLAGAQSVAALRAHGFTGRVVLLGDEGVPPYDRPPLSKDLFTRPEPVWLSADIGVDVGVLADEVRLDDPAVAWRPGTVTTRSGDSLAADAVVLACGSRPVVPPGWGADVLHTAADAERLRRDLGAGVRLVVVGAGWVGSEVAGVAAGAGAHVTVVEAGPAPLARQLGTRVGGLLAPWFADAGVRLLLDSPASSVRPDGVTLGSGEHVPGDVVLAAVGARPATAWLRATLPPDAFDDVGTLRVDARGAVTGVPGLWAVGDAATRPHPVLGRVPGGHWSSALHDPDDTVRALLGLDAGAPHAPYVFSRQLGHDLALFGMPGGDPTVLRGTPGDGAWAAFWTDAVEPGPTDGRAAGTTRDGAATVHAVLLVDSPRDVGAVRKAMNRPAPLVVDLDAAADPAVRLRDALAG